MCSVPHINLKTFAPVSHTVKYIVLSFCDFRRKEEKEKGRGYLERRGTSVLRLDEDIVARALELVLLAVKGGVMGFPDGCAHRGAIVVLALPPPTSASAVKETAQRL